ncbi:MAG: hypothetical protein QF886_26400, partial [Planctomycetota bacterium]|nr:hypothetical protein [Planctomycetota bacterium]
MDGLLERLLEHSDMDELNRAIPDFLWRLSDLELESLKDDLKEIFDKGFKARPFNTAIKEARLVEQQKCNEDALSQAHEKAQERGKVGLWNFDTFVYLDKKGNVAEGKTVIPESRIRMALQAQTDGWPRRVGSLLFYDEKGSIRYLENCNSAFAWIQEQVSLHWNSGLDANNENFVAKPEFFEHLGAKVENYEGVEVCPHHPPLDAHYYAWREPKSYTPTGEHFEKLLSFFDNAETEHDAALIRAMFMTPAWGGHPGSRPAFAIMARDRGYGKSTLAEVVGRLYGGHVELMLESKAEEKFVSRLLTPEAMKRRLVRIDNIKQVYGSESIEGLITSEYISGHRLYHGDAA